MASVPVVMQRVRRARRRCEQPRTARRFREYESEYEAIFSAVEERCGEAALDEISEWALETTRREQRLPTPETVRARAREVCDEHGASVREDSALAE